MIIKLLIEGGDMKPSPAIAQQLGPLGINMGKVISEVNLSTKDFKGITVPVNLNIDMKTKNFTINVLSPATSQLIKKELGITIASGQRRKIIAGNIAFERVVSVAKLKKDDMLSKDFLSALKSVIGSCMSLGVLIDNKDPKEILEDINNKKYAEEIENQKTEVSAEKRKSIDEFFSQIKSKQDANKKAEDAAKEAQDAKAKQVVSKTPSSKPDAQKTPAKKK